MSHKFKVGEGKRRSLAFHYTLTTDNDQGYSWLEMLPSDSVVRLAVVVVV